MEQHFLAKQTFFFAKTERAEIKACDACSHMRHGSFITKKPHCEQSPGT